MYVAQRHRKAIRMFRVQLQLAANQRIPCLVQSGCFRPAEDLVSVHASGSLFPPFLRTSSQYFPAQNCTWYRNLCMVSKLLNQAATKLAEAEAGNFPTFAAFVTRKEGWVHFL